jgi:hypothetical protein
MLRSRVLLVAVASLAFGGRASAFDVQIGGKLTIVDKLNVNGNAKMVFAACDGRNARNGKERRD